MIVLIETDRGGLCHQGSIFGVNPKIKEYIVGNHNVLEWHGVRAVQVRSGDPATASAYAFACSGIEQAQAMARKIPGFRLLGPRDYNGYYTYVVDANVLPAWARNALMKG